MYTNVAKPTGTPYTGVNTAKPNYDETSLSYDDSATFYDGADMSAYTDVAKPFGGIVLRAGMTIGLLMPLTNPVDKLIGNPYINIPKPT